MEPDHELSIEAGRPLRTVNNMEFYDAFYKNNDEAVIKLCNEAADGPLHHCTIHKSTMLHLACYFKKWELANTLFDSLTENHLDILSERTNSWGDTVLHDVSTSNSHKAVKLAEKMLRTRPKLLQVRNEAGETCVFRATRYGKMKMFKFLAQKVDTFCKTHKEIDPLHFFQREDKNTILHMAILTRNFDMALVIARKYPNLCHLRAASKLTALQILACSPTAFESGARFGLVMYLLYKCVSIDEEGDKDEVGLIDDQKQNKKASLIKKALECCCNGKSCCISPMIDEVRKMKKGHEDALKLSEILIQDDSSWMFTHKLSAEGTLEVARVQNSSGDKPKEENTTSGDSPREEKKNGRHENIEIKRGKKDYETDISDSDSNEAPLSLVAARKECIKFLNEALKKYAHEEYESDILQSDEAPLLMAARKGCIEIVEKTLEKYPQAVYYVNSNQENLLHLAIKTRNIEIFDYVEKNVTFIRGLLSALDKDNNSILHMVGCPRKEHLDTEMKSPVLQLSDDLGLLERLKDMCPSYLQYHRNIDLKTADELFAEKNEKLRKEAKEWLRKTSEHSTVVIILIATVAFAAAYTVPGGPDEKTGYPLLLTRPLFLVFAVTDVLSLGFALTAVVVFLSIITSSYQLKDFRTFLPCRLFLGFTLLFLSVTMMMVAFAATIILMVNDKRRWTKIALYVVAFFPICIFMLSYIPIYATLAKHIRDWFIELHKLLPRPKKNYSLPCTTRPASGCSSSKSV